MSRTPPDHSGAWGPTVLRVVTGTLMAGHGLQKLAGWFGGSGLAPTAAGFERMALRPARHHAVVAGVGETASGVASVLGLWTPAASAITSGTMTIAVAKVHGRHGPWITKGGYEYNVTLMATSFALAAVGPGRLALDGHLTRRRAGLGWAVAQLGVGVATAMAVLAVSARWPEPEPAADGAPA